MKKPRQTVDIARGFSEEPIGRYRTDSEISGEAFREDVLLPALRDAEVVEILLDGTEGYGSSFLEEAFGGALRHSELTLNEFQQRVVLVSEEDPTLIEEIMGYVADAEKRRLSKDR